MSASVQPDEIAIIADVIAGAVRSATESLNARIAVLEARAPLAGKDGRDGLNGKDVDPVLLQTAIDVAVTKAVAALPLPAAGARGEKGDAGADAPPPDLDLLAATVIALMPVPKDGKDGIDGVNGKDGVSGRDGKDGADGLDGKDGANGRDGLDGRDGRDGLGITDAMVTKDGALTLIFSNGTTRVLGSVVGSKGIDGRDGKDGKDGASGRDGQDGADGEDGLGFDDMIQTYDETAKAFVWEYRRGDQVKRFAFPDHRMIFRGVFEAGMTYLQGDCVTRGGSVWHANATTTAVPGEGSKEWTLIAKRGGEGKQGPQGQKGEPGRDHPAWFDPS